MCIIVTLVHSFDSLIRDDDDNDALIMASQSRRRLKKITMSCFIGPK